MFLVLAFSATAFGIDCPLPPGQSAPPACCGGHDCCTSVKPCGVGEGDCDTDADCQGNLTCGKNNCPANDDNYDDTDDCCEDLTVCPTTDPVKGGHCGKADLACNSTETDVCGNPLCQFICSDNTPKWEEVCFGELACDPSVCLAKDPIKGASCGKADLACNSTETDLCGNPLCLFTCNNNTMEWDEVCFGACDPTVCPATDPVDGAKCGKADLICPSKTGGTCCGQPLCLFNCDEDTMTWEERCMGDCDPSNCAKTCQEELCTKLKTHHELVVMARLAHHCPNQAGEGKPTECDESLLNDLQECTAFDDCLLNRISKEQGEACKGPEEICGTLHRLQETTALSRFAHCNTPKSETCPFWEELMMTPEILAAKAACSYMLDGESFFKCVRKVIGDKGMLCFCDVSPLGKEDTFGLLPECV